MSNEDAVLFKPSMSAKPRLKGLGINTYTAMVRFNVCINEEIQKNLAFQVLRSQGGRTLKLTNQILD